jgi:hypothetical protein
MFKAKHDSNLHEKQVKYIQRNPQLMFPDFRFSLIQCSLINVTVNLPPFKIFLNLSFEETLNGGFTLSPIVKKGNKKKNRCK